VLANVFLIFVLTYSFKQLVKQSK